MTGLFKKHEKIIVICFAVITVAISCLPFIREGIPGYEPDLLFHLLRVEGVRDSLLSGVFPGRLYDNFFGGYVYGSPLFYPDLFLVIPAFLRIIGFSVVASWKIFVAMVVCLVFAVSYFSFRIILKDPSYTLLATMLLCLSQFYLADLQVRVGLSEYIAFIFLPVWMAGIYDFFAYEGRRIYLIGIGLTGMLLTHTIMTFIGGLMTVIIFAAAIITKKGRRVIFEPKRLIRLFITAGLSLGFCAYYLIPMIEQMIAHQYRYTTPIQKVGEFYQSFKYFFNLRPMRTFI